MMSSPVDMLSLRYLQVSRRVSVTLTRGQDSEDTYLGIIKIEVTAKIV